MEASIDTRLIPDCLLLRAFRKMSPLEGVRVIRTSRFVKNLVETSNISFSPGSQFKHHLTMHFRKSDPNWSFELVVIPLDADRQSFAKKISMSNINFSFIVFDTIVFKGVGHSIKEYFLFNENEFLQLKKLNYKCRSLVLKGFHHSQFSKICSVVSFSSFINYSPQQLYDIIDVVPRNKCCDIETLVSEMPPSGTLLQRIRHLERLIIRQKSPNWVDEFSHFLQNVRQMSSGCLKSVTIDILPPKKVGNGFFPVDTHYESYFWPGCHFVWGGHVILSRNQQAENVQITLTTTPEKTAVITTYNISSWLPQRRNIRHEICFVEKRNCEEIVYAVFNKLCEHKPMDMSHVVEHLKGSSSDNFPSIIREYLQQINFHRYDLP